jgi:signal transduction histidine kinase
MTWSWRLIQERVCGRHAISLPIFLISVPFWIVGFVSNEPLAYESPQNAMLILAIAAVGQVLMGITLLLAHFSVARKRKTKPVSIWVMATVWAAAGSVRIIAIVVAFEAFNLANEIPLATRLGVGATMAVVGYGLASYGMDALDRFRNERALILADLIESEEQLAAHRATVATMEGALIEQVNSRLRASQAFSAVNLDRLEKSLANRTDAKPELEELRSLSEKTWQTISQELWEKAPHGAPKIKVSEALALFARSGPFRVPFFVAAAPFLFLLVYGRVFDTIPGAVITMAWLGGTVTVSLVFNWLLARLTRLVKAALVLSTGAMVLSSIPLLAVTQMSGIGPEEPFRVIAIHAVTMMMVMLLALFPTVAKAGQQILDNLHQHIDQATIEKLHVESQLAVASKKLASRLHGDVRGNFLASVLRLQKYIESDDIQAARETIERLRHLLNESIEWNPEQTAGEDKEQLSQFLTNWSALVDIAFDKPLDSIPGDFIPVVHTIVVEAVANAVRHGGADWIRITFTLDEGDGVLSVLNNGQEKPTGRVGLGTLNLNQIAGDQWSRFTNDQGMTQLVVRLERNRLRSLTSQS